MPPPPRPAESWRSRTRGRPKAAPSSSSAAARRCCSSCNLSACASLRAVFSLSSALSCPFTSATCSIMLCWMDIFDCAMLSFISLRCSTSRCKESFSALVDSTSSRTRLSCPASCSRSSDSLQFSLTNFSCSAFASDCTADLASSSAALSRLHSFSSFRACFCRFLLCISSASTPRLAMSRLLWRRWFTSVSPSISAWRLETCCLRSRCPAATLSSTSCSRALWMPASASACPTRRCRSTFSAPTRSISRRCCSLSCCIASCSSSCCLDAASVRSSSAVTMSRLAESAERCTACRAALNSSSRRAMRSRPRRTSSSRLSLSSWSRSLRSVSDLTCPAAALPLEMACLASARAFIASASKSSFWLL
mmetsp:Transcript_32138/g.91170  ORF Transcript_32138/g.91170 Transcript_32138/m.91170 type:complete len:365 (-) Transcript_32138:897-1991(-)